MQPRFTGISKASSTCTVCRKEGSSYIASDQIMMDSSNASEECSESSEFFHVLNNLSNFLGGMPPHTPILCMLIMLCTMSFAATLSEGLVHYCYMP